jgi:L-ribulokinase
MKEFFTIGVDYGTNSVRSIVVNVATGKEVGSFVFNYPSGRQGILLDKNDHHLARQNPADYIKGAEVTIVSALKLARRHKGFSPDNVIGIGVDTTGSTPIPVDRDNVPLALQSKWKRNLAAHAWLWKDHTSAAEAAMITEAARTLAPRYIERYGGAYSSEWFWAKIWHCLNSAPEVFEAAYSWVELADFVPALLAGVKDPTAIVRGVCAAGHKAMFSRDWGGLPDKKFLASLDPKLAALRDRLFATAYDAGTPAGALCIEWAEKIALRAGIPIAIGAFDAHYGAIGAGVAEGTLVKIIGTSTCDCTVVSRDHKKGEIPGICGTVLGSILPDYFGVEAGQSAVGDIFNGLSRSCAETTDPCMPPSQSRRKSCFPDNRVSLRSTGTTGTGRSWWIPGSPDCSSDKRCTRGRRRSIARSSRGPPSAPARLSNVSRSTACRSTVSCAAAASRKRIRCSCRSTPT